MNVSTTVRIRLAALVLGAAALLVPLTVTSRGVESNEVCARGTCCFEPGTICTDDGGVRVGYVFRRDGCPNGDR